MNKKYIAEPYSRHSTSRQSPTYLVDVLEGVEDVVGQTRQEVDDEPTLEIVHADHIRIRHDLATGADERRVEVEDNVDEEDDVDDTVNQSKVLFHAFTIGLPCSVYKQN